MPRLGSKHYSYSPRGIAQYKRDKKKAAAGAAVNEKEKGEKNWIQGAVNPEHEGFCTPMTKATCTPRRKAFAKTMKKHNGFQKEDMSNIYDRTLDLLGEDKKKKKKGAVTITPVDQSQETPPEEWIKGAGPAPTAAQGPSQRPLTAKDRDKIKRSDLGAALQQITVADPEAARQVVSPKKMTPKQQKDLGKKLVGKIKGKAPTTSLGAKLTKGIHPARNTAFGIAKAITGIGTAVSDTVKSAKKQSGHVSTKKRSEKQNDNTEYTNMNNTYARMTVLVEAQMEEGIFRDLAKSGAKGAAKIGTAVVGRTPVLGTAVRKGIDTGRAIKHGYGKFAAAIKGKADAPLRPQLGASFKKGREARVKSKEAQAKMWQGGMGPNPGAPAATPTPTAKASLADLAKRRGGGGAAGVARAVYHVRGQQDSDAATPPPTLKSTDAKPRIVRRVKPVDPSKFGAGLGRYEGFGKIINYETEKDPRIKDPHVKTKVKTDSTIYVRIGDLLGEKAASTSDFTSQGYSPMAARMRRKMMGPGGIGSKTKRQQDQDFGTSLPQGGRANKQL